jgi:hypothetical protein
MSHGIRTDDRQLAEDLKLCQEAAKDLMPDSVLYFRLDARKATGLIEELIDLRATLSRVEAERDGLRAFVLEKTLDLDVYISGKGIVQPTHQEFRDRNFVLDHIRADLRAIRAAVKPTTTEGEKP